MHKFKTIHIMIVSLLVIILAAFVISDEFAYEYDENAVDEAVYDEGQRLVGATRGNVDSIPFLVAYNPAVFNSSLRFTTCTGSLITPTIILSAAHCILDVVDTQDIVKCLNISRTSTFSNKFNGRVRCTHVADDNIKIELIKPTGVAYLGVNNVNSYEDVKLGQSIEIDYIIRHKHSYRGGGSYGTYGGFDITLLHLTNSAFQTPACLPGIRFKDSGIGPGYNIHINASLAGYGAYYRAPCLTDALGPSRYHYCRSNTNCLTKSAPPQNSKCEEFFSKQQTVYKIPDNIYKVAIKINNTEEDCYRASSGIVGSYGWCDVDTDANTLGVLTNAKSWGFCSEDCFLRNNLTDLQPDFDVLRRIDQVDVLDDHTCAEFLNTALQNAAVSFRPEILCIGKLGSSITEKYTKKDNTFSHIGSEFSFFVTSSGACSGDSGGPVYVRDIKSGRFVVLGTVSGGHGELGRCGGINNPTHYVRMKSLASWIQLVLGEEKTNICWVGNE